VRAQRRVARCGHAQHDGEATDSEPAVKKELILGGNGPRCTSCTPLHQSRVEVAGK
jgi:hypothetical protein